INSGGQQRTSQGVDVETTGDATGTYNVGWTGAGEWLKYTVNVTTAGTYSFQARVASPNTGKSFHVDIDGNTFATVAVPNTTGWQTYQLTPAITTPNLTIGNHTMRIYMDTDGFNLNYVSFTSTTAAKPVITSATTASASLGAPFSYTITATNTPTSYNATGLPAGLTVNTSTGVISGTPTNAGNSNVTITASNTAGGNSATLVISVTAATDPLGVITCYKAPAAITVNGNLSEQGWNVSRQFSKTVYGAVNNTATFGVLWDNTNLYIGVKVLDANLYSDSPDWWEDDAVEVYIDANYNRLTTYDGFDNQIIKGYNKSGVSTKLAINGLQHAWAATAGGYTIELAVPWSQLGISAPAPGLNLGFDISYDDDDNGGSREGQAAWNGTVDNYQNTSAFGKLTLNAGIAPRFGGQQSLSAQESSVSIYPNPVTSQNLTAIVPLAWSGTANVSVWSATGILVHSSEQEIVNNQCQLNLLDLKSGIYFLQIGNGGNMVTEKFIVQ
ncbi:MAG: sugar-binding protein, partial [Cytophagaceae bacterium]